MLFINNTHHKKKYKNNSVWPYISKINYSISEHYGSWLKKKINMDIGYAEDIKKGVTRDLETDPVIVGQ